MRKTNFKCPQSGEEIFVPSHIYSGEKYYRSYKGQKGEEILSTVGIPMKPIEKKVDWSDGKTPHFGIGKDSRGKAKMQKMLKERSNKHFRKDVKGAALDKVRHFDKTGEQS